MTKPSYGVIVARCQVHELHEGHLALFREVKARHNRVIVFLGQKPIGTTYNNPLDFETRKLMVQAKFPEFFVLPLNDCADDKVWSAKLDEKIREMADYGEVTLYGGRDSFVPHYSGVYKVVELALPIGTNTNGTDIRAKLTNTVMESADFRAGCIYERTNIRPNPKLTVDIAITYGDKLLLGRKPDETNWRFVGGHVDCGETAETAAKREAMEETGLDVSDVQLVGSVVINDWRWKGEPENVLTLLFWGKSGSMLSTAKDDIAEVKWFDFETMSDYLIVNAHKELFIKFKEEWNKRKLWKA